MIERNINVARVNASNRLTAIKPVTLSAVERSHAYEFVLYAVESMQAVIDYEIASSRGDRPIVESMRAYVRDAKGLLSRLK
jgi:hypothetical protein